MRNMFRTTRKIAIVLTSAAALVALVSPAAFADAGDTLTPANTSVSITGSVNITGTVDGFIPINFTCNVALTAKTPLATAPSLTASVTSDPVFSSCTGTPGIKVTSSGTWSLTNNDAGDPATEPQKTGDQLVINIPANGATFTDSNLSGCTIKANAQGVTSSSYNDGSGSGATSTSASYSNDSLSVTASGCTSSGTKLASGTFSSSTSVQDTA
jgi:hypothetical protein